MVLKEGSVFSLQIWGSVISPNSRKWSKITPIFNYVCFKLFFPFNFEVECHLPKLQCRRIKKIFTSML